MWKFVGILALAALVVAGPSLRRWRKGTTSLPRERRRTKVTPARKSRSAWRTPPAGRAAGPRAGDRVVSQGGGSGLRRRAVQPRRRVRKGTRRAADYAQAIVWFRKAADQGYAAAQYNLGVSYAAGQDYVQAVVWWRKAADQGYAAAQYNLGAVYDTGQGVPQDHAQAIVWFRKAADQGSADAQSNLGSMYLTGQASRRTPRRRWCGFARRRIRASPPRSSTSAWRMPTDRACRRTIRKRRSGIARRRTRAMPPRSTTSACCTPRAGRATGLRGGPQVAASCGVTGHRRRRKEVCSSTRRCREGNDTRADRRGAETRNRMASASERRQPK